MGDGHGTRSRRAALSLGPGTGFVGDFGGDGRPDGLAGSESLGRRRGGAGRCWICDDLLVPCRPDARWALALSRTRSARSRRLRKAQ